ncbi:sulfatase-like hydrolase/transferase [Arcticibacterium luteifluviistationis]|uniref:N-acetylgalactosamine 6-sulfate sulfatase n=1 Tax=Arcticibacterium luteifluviistationis TaxID=1784714 RepID=A0A2Z4GBE5_9BACT|nr:sulfatase-like hydrolase/transferase [Arcticibacterium luteifluviistationis]AWV98385.1 N-acetylgalactosamine 6-sulfate sulfatase [Arcticibacterium luteifluviistationis]
MKKVLILFSALILASCNKATNDLQEGDKPNVVFILVDDLGKEWVSSFGADDIETPNIDKLAASGMSFNNFYSMPQCTPTRVSFLTAQYPFRHGWVNHWDVPRWGGGAHFDETHNPSLVRAIRDSGYKTCIAGKWQIDDFRVEPDALIKSGFDNFCMWTGYEGGVEASANRYQDPYIFSDSQNSKTYKDKFGPDVFAGYVKSFIKENKDKPMFIYYPMVLTHSPFVNTPDEEADTVLGKHKAMVRYADKLTGEIVETIEKAGILDNTVIIWTTDNGTSGNIVGTLDGRTVKGGKGSTKESGINEPFIVSWPSKIKKGQVSEALIDITDILPTSLDLIDDEMTSSYMLDGKSFKGVLLGESEKSQKRYILGMGGGNNAKLTDKGVENQYIFRDRVLRDERFKLYVDSHRQPIKFVDLKADPAEEIDIKDDLSSEESKHAYAKLVGEIINFPEEDAEPIYVNNPTQVWDVEITAESKSWKK